MTNRLKNQMVNLGYLILAEDAKPIEKIDHEYSKKLQTEWLVLIKEINRQKKEYRKTEKLLINKLMKEIKNGKENICN